MFDTPVSELANEAMDEKRSWITREPEDMGESLEKEVIEIDSEDGLVESKRGCRGKAEIVDLDKDFIPLGKGACVDQDDIISEDV